MIDAHLHLWDKQHGMVDGLPVYDLGGGRSQFGSVVRQMTPAYINDGVNSEQPPKPRAAIKASIIVAARVVFLTRSIVFSIPPKKGVLLRSAPMRGKNTLCPPS